MKRLCALVLFLCFVSAGQAQQLKFFAGPAISHYSAEWPYYGNVWFAGAHLNPFENRRMGFMAGGGLEIALNKIISFELDGLYFQKGSTFEGTYWFGNTYRYTYVLSGISVPLIVKFEFLPRPFPYFLSGLEFSYLTAHTRVRSYRTVGPYEWKEMPKENLIDETRRFDFGPVVGLGFEARLHKISLFLEARYSLGLVDLPVRRDPLQPEPRTSSLVILSGIKFN
jgi:hypothetical protein